MVLFEQARDGPVQFEKDSDPFGIDSMIKEVTGGQGGGGGGGGGGKRRSEEELEVGASSSKRYKA